MSKAILYFLAGVFGALVMDVFALIFGTLPSKSVLGVEFAPNIDLIALLIDLLSGGLWGLLFFLPIFNSNFILKGAVISIFPFLFHLLIRNRLFGDIEVFSPAPNWTVIAIIFAFDLFWGLVSGSFLAFINENPKITGQE